MQGAPQKGSRAPIWTVNPRLRRLAAAAHVEARWNSGKAKTAGRSDASRSPAKARTKPTTSGSSNAEPKEATAGSPSRLKPAAKSAPRPDLAPGQLGHEQPRVGADLSAQQDQAAFLEARLQDGQGSLEERLFDVRLAEEDHDALDTSRREGLLKGLLLAGEIGSFRPDVEGGPVCPGGLPMGKGLPDRFRRGLFEGLLPVEDDDGEPRLGGQGFQRRECAVGGDDQGIHAHLKGELGRSLVGKGRNRGDAVPALPQEDDFLRTGGLFQGGRKGGGRLAHAEDPRSLGDRGRRGGFACRGLACLQKSVMDETHPDEIGQGARQVFAVGEEAVLETENLPLRHGQQPQVGELSS